MSNIVQEIYEAQVRKRTGSVPRAYLGMSLIGGECDYAIWCNWRQITPRQTDGRIYLLFELGNHVEKIVCSALRQAGYVLENAYPDEQITYSDLNGYFNGHPDGIVKDTTQDMILEIKSAKESKFKQMKKNGVQEVYPQYYAQMQLYMSYQNVSRALFICMCKNNSELYDEIITADDFTAQVMLEKAKKIITTDKPPEKTMNEHCQYCNYRWQCEGHKDFAQTIVTCRSCRYFKMTDDFTAMCTRVNKPLKTVLKSCSRWSFILDNLEAK